mmetsp:Transcript_11510/g.13134  ORF Transcript_11510/g.13134 Transcript_11510/m.13134 type:complete len:112 (-) Transcript_11510:203-538(-)
MKRDSHDIMAAVSSRTDEPSWARICMNWLCVEDGTPLKGCFDHLEISKGNKVRHFESLNRITGISFENMCFFDNEYNNIQDVSSLGVSCIYTPDGMERKHWEMACEKFQLN